MIAKRWPDGCLLSLYKYLTENVSMTRKTGEGIVQKDAVRIGKLCTVMGGMNKAEVRLHLSYLIKAGLITVEEKAWSPNRITLLKMDVTPEQTRRILEGADLWAETC